MANTEKAEKTAPDTRDALVSAARVCFARYGFERTTNRAIADAAGMTTGIIYYYFDSKQALFRAVMDEVANLVIEEFTRAVESESRFDAQLAALLDAAARIHEDDSSIAAFTVSSPIDIYRDPELVGHEPMGESTFQTFFHDFVHGAAARGEIPDNMDPVDVENMVVSLTLGLAYYGLLSGTPAVLRSAMNGTVALFSMALGPDQPD